MASGKKNYFRHVFNAHRNADMAELIRKKGFDYYGRWWVLVELLAEQAQDGCKDEYKLHLNTLRTSLQSNSKGVLTFLKVTSTFTECSVNVEGNYAFFKYPNLSSFIGTYRVQMPLIKGKERKGKESKVKESKVKEKPATSDWHIKLSSLFSDTGIQDFVSRATKESVKILIEAHDEEHLRKEITKAYVHDCEQLPHKRKKLIGKYLINWFSNQEKYDREKKSSPSSMKGQILNLMEGVNDL